MYRVLVDNKLVKEYPYKIQCWTWALMNGYITKHRHWYFKDERLEIKEQTNERNDR